MEETNQTNKKSNEITLNKVTIWKAISGILFLLLIASIYTSGFGLFEKTTPTGNGVINNKPQQPTPEEQAPVIDMNQIDLTGQPMLGEEDAAITIIEFSDFQCPYCSRAANGPVKEVIKNYVDTGKAKLYFMNYPLGFHQYAQAAAEASECANEQGRFWEMHDKIFENQGSLSQESLVTWAKELKLDMNMFNTCLNDGKYKQEVQKDMAIAQSAGVQGTPSFLINGNLIVGAQPFEAFKQILDAA
jgi:protein-disulfide isomerase